MFRRNTGADSVVRTSGGVCLFEGDASGSCTPVHASSYPETMAGLRCSDTVADACTLPAIAVGLQSETLRQPDLGAGGLRR